MLVLAASGPAIAAAPAGADEARPSPERIVCRRAIQYATRIGPRRACRLESEWRAMREGRSVDDRVAEDADRLSAMADRISTGNLGGNDLIPADPH